MYIFHTCQLWLKLAARATPPASHRSARTRQQENHGARNQLYTTLRSRTVSIPLKNVFLILCHVLIHRTVYLDICSAFPV